MAKSAMEALNRRFEEESGDTNVDIEVIVNADGEAAEDIIEATDAGEQAAEDVAISQENEEATQEASDMAELATTLRRYGLTPGMAAVLKVTVPLATYGISLPAMESLDSSGRNQAVADRIANRLEVAVEGFWDSTKKFFKRILLRIVQALQWIANHVGSIRGRVNRAHNSIKDRVWDPDMEKDRKFPELKEQDEFNAALGKIYAFLENGLNDIKDRINDPMKNVLKAGQGSSVEKDVLGTISEDDLKKGIGYKLTESKSGIEADSAVKPETDSKTAESKHLEGCKKQYYNDVISDLDKTENLAKKRDLIQDTINTLDSRNKEKEEDAEKGLKEALSNLRAKLSVLSSVLSKYNSVISKLAMVYVKQCSAIRLCTKARA